MDAFRVRLWAKTFTGWLSSSRSSRSCGLSATWGQLFPEHFSSA